MQLEHILYEKRDHIAWVTINRPEVRNALNARCHQDMRAAFEDFAQDDDLRVAILTGAGDRAFCAGADLKAAHQRNSSSTPPADHVFGGITRDFDCDKPIIAAVNGFALGGGTELALACDLVVAADTAQFGLPEPLRGLVAGAGGVHRLVRQLPLKQAMNLILTGKPVNAQEAFGLGLVNLVVPLESLLGAAERLAGDIMLGSPMAVRMSKQLAMNAMSPEIDARIEAQGDLIKTLLASDDVVEGARAFVERRDPVWSGQ